MLWRNDPEGRGGVAHLIPPFLLEFETFSDQAKFWLKGLPKSIERAQLAWGLSLGPPFGANHASCSWVAKAKRSDGSSAILKFGLPHFEAHDEAIALQHWDGNGAVRLLEYEPDTGAMLLELCEPGHSLKTRPDQEQDIVVCELLKMLWRKKPETVPFRPLSSMVEHWRESTLKERAKWPDPGLVEEGLSCFHQLTQSTQNPVLLATDLHAGNVLAAQRTDWLVIDPKPFFGDPCYDITQHLLNGRQRLEREPELTVASLAERLEIPAQRVYAWLFARLASEPRENWIGEANLRLIHKLDKLRGL